MAGIPGNTQQRIGGPAHQQPVQQALVLQDKRAQWLRQGKDDVEIGHIQQVLVLSSHPVGLFLPLALRTVAIAAGVVGNQLISALRTLAAVSTQYSGSTGGQVLDDASLKPAGRVLLKILPGIAGQYIPHFRGCSAHQTVGVGCPRDGNTPASRSSDWLRLAREAVAM